MKKKKTHQYEELMPKAFTQNTERGEILKRDNEQRSW